MKKILFILLVAFAAVSCTTTEDPIDLYEMTYEVPSGSWRLTDDGQYFYCEIPEPRLSDNMYYNGSFVSYIVNNLKNGSETLTPLPYDVYSMNGSNYRWTEQYTAEFSVGYITFIMKVNDFDFSEAPSGQVFVVKYLSKY